MDAVRHVNWWVWAVAMGASFTHLWHQSRGWHVNPLVHGSTSPRSREGPDVKTVTGRPGPSIQWGACSWARISKLLSSLGLSWRFSEQPYANGGARCNG